MGLAALPFTFPLLPLRGMLALARLIAEEAEREAADPARMRRELAGIEQAAVTGEMTAAEAATAQAQVTARYLQARNRNTRSGYRERSSR